MHYLVALIAPLVVLQLGWGWASTVQRLLVLAATSAVCMYAITVGTAFSLSAWYGYQAEQFDTNNDGVISLTEQSQEQSEAMERMINDSGRNMTVFLAAPWSVAVSGGFFLLVAAARAAMRRRVGTRPRASE